MTGYTPIGTCSHDRTELAAFVLGGLGDAETDQLQEQIEHCAACENEARELSQLRDLLSEAHGDRSGIPNHIHRRVRDRVVAVAAARRSRRRWATIAVAVAVLGAAGGGGIARVIVEPRPTVVTVAASTVEPFEAAGSVGFARADQAGIVVMLDLNGLEELAEPAVYEAWLYHADGRIISIGQVDVVDGSVHAQLAVAGELHQFRGFWLTAEPDRNDPSHSGPTVVRATVPQW